LIDLGRTGCGNGCITRLETAFATVGASACGASPTFGGAMHSCAAPGRCDGKDAGARSGAAQPASPEDGYFGDGKVASAQVAPVEWEKS
jgi:hypothetical protein